MSKFNVTLFKISGIKKYKFAALLVIAFFLTLNVAVNGAENPENKKLNAVGSKLVNEGADHGPLGGTLKKPVEIEVPWESIPVEVQKTLTINASGKPVGVVKKETEGRKVSYVGRVLNGDESHLVIKVSRDGALISITTREGYPGKQWEKDTKVSMSNARAVALKLIPGKVIDQELEKEGGGSGLRYSFDIKTGRGVGTVDIDAVTGKVLEKSM